MFDKVKKIYMIGIKGVGMTMLAQFLACKGYEIEGSDTDEVFMTDQVLEKSKIRVREGFDRKNLSKDIDLIIYSTAYNEKTNEEVETALKGKKKVLTYAEAMGEVFREQFGVAVVGTHGKTTTSAWLAYVLLKSGKSPSAMIGARVPQLEGTSLCGHSDVLVIEADEYQNKLSYFDPKSALLNNIGYDHPDYFPSEGDYDKVFIDFIKKIPRKGFLVANYDDKKIQRYAAVNCRGKIITYAIDEAADYVAYDIRQSSTGQIFGVKISSEDVVGESYDLGEFQISLLGRHNIYNALAVIAAAIEMDTELHELRTHLEEFSGCDRRLEMLGQFCGVPVIDDYAHHPEEVDTTVKAIREKYKNNNLRVAFHPHTFTRTKAMIDEFAKSFSFANEVILIDIYGSAREEHGGVHSRDLLKKIKDYNQAKGIEQKLEYKPTLDDLEEYLRSSTQKNDVILLLGAGDIFRVGQSLVK